MTLTARHGRVYTVLADAPEETDLGCGTSDCCVSPESVAVGASRTAAEMTPALSRRLLAEFLGSALRAAVVVGSGIAAQRLSPGDVGVELFENAAAAAGGLYAILLVFGR